jgi:hypothetical protein
MGSAKAKSINLLLYEGDLNGVISIEDTSWNSGELYSAPRSSVSDLLETGACSKYGVYLLLSQEMVYIGQSSDLAKRITQHTVGKDWWESVVILTTKDDSLNHSDIDYLESVLIEKAFSVNRLDCDNKNKGNPPKVDKFRKVYLGQYLEEALFLMQLIGISVFSSTKGHQPPAKADGALLSTVDIHTKLAIGKRAKNEAVQYLQSQGVSLSKKVSYAVKQDNKEEFWVNPLVEKLNGDWELILNNNVTHELVVMCVPAYTFKLQTASEKGLFVRADKPNRIALSLNPTTFKDYKSGLDFAPYITNRIKY